MTMGYAVGVGLAHGLAIFARAAGFDRDRAFYPTVLAASAAYYTLFAAASGSAGAVAVEAVLALGFTFAAVAGFKYSPWLVVAGLAAHGLVDFFHASVVSNAGVPEWWPAFCLAFDFALAAYLASGWRGGSAISLEARRRAW